MLEWIAPRGMEKAKYLSNSAHLLSFNIVTEILSAYRYKSIAVIIDKNKEMHKPAESILRDSFLLLLEALAATKREIEVCTPAEHREKHMA